MTRILDVVRFVGRSTKRIAVAAVGGTLLVLGIAMLVLPGPGVVVIALGLAVLATEFAWAAFALERGKATATRAVETGKRTAGYVVDTSRRAARRAGRRR